MTDYLYTCVSLLLIIVAVFSATLAAIWVFWFVLA